MKLLSFSKTRVTREKLYNEEVYLVKAELEQCHLKIRLNYSTAQETKAPGELILSTPVLKAL